jgi:threonine dehydrogenase-like Zn-dependent dehydrogenase
MVSVVGAHFEPDYPLNNALMFEREITLRFTIGDPASDREKLLAILAEGKLDPTEIITHRLPLAEARQAYQRFYRHVATKVVLQP